TLEAAGAIARPAEPRAASLDRVVDQAAAIAARVERVGEFDALGRGDRGERLCDPTVEAAIPLDVASEPGDDARRAHRGDAAQRVARVTCRGDRRHHPTGRLAVAAPDLARLDGIAIEGGGGRYVADPDRLAEHVDPDGAQEGPRDAAGRDARRGLARARTLDHVADVLVTVLERSGKVR